MPNATSGEQNDVWDIMLGHPATTLMHIADFAPLVETLDHPEGVACGPAGEIYAGGEAGQIYRIAMDGTVAAIGTTGGFVLGLCLDADLNVYACDLARHAVVRVSPSGEARVYSEGSVDRKMTTPNYPVFDAAGNLYVSDSGTWNGDDGCLFRVHPDGETVLVSDQLSSFPNGLALHPGGEYLYVVLSQLPGVVRARIISGGSLGEPESVVTLPHHVPDGLAFDEEGNLYVACYTPHVIYRVTPDGRVAIVASDPEGVTFATPTNIAFCDADRQMLVVASLSRWHVATGRMPIPGQRLHYPRLTGV